MNKAANSYWTDNRLAAQRPMARSMTLLVPAARELSRPVVGGATVGRASARRRRFTVPSWAVFCMIIMTTFALCVTVTMRTHAEKRFAVEKFERMNSDVQALRNTNAAIERELRRLHNDPRAVETAARTKLNMVRADEIIVPVK